MTNENNNEKHEQTKKKLKVIGFVCIFCGLICIITGFVDFFSSFGNGMPKLMWLLFIGFPLFSVGAILLMFAYRREIMQYGKNESVPVINEASKEVTPAVKNIVDAVKSSDDIICPKCSTINDKGSKFCKKCGHSLFMTCPNCGNTIDSNSTFCNHCGHKL